jgi:hypothetical protein
MVRSLVDPTAAVADRSPSSFFALPVFFDYSPGSSSSIAMIDVVQEQGQSELYTSETTKHYIKYKWSKVSWLYWLLFGVYVLYLGSIMYWRDKWFVFIAWFGFYFVLEMIQLFGNFRNWKSNLDFWNFLQYLNLAALASTGLCQYFYEP